MTTDWSEDLEDGSDPDAVPAVPAPPSPAAPAAASAAATAPTPLTREQQTALRSRIDAIRADKTSPVNHGPGHPRFAEAQAELESMYKALYPPGAKDDGAPAAAPAPPMLADPVTGAVHPMDDPHAVPTTAAELAAIPPPDFAAAAQQAGWQWDKPKLATLYTTAEAEGLVPMVREGLRVITQIAAEPLDAEAEERAFLQAHGSRAAAKLDAVERFEGLLRAKHPEILARLEATGRSESRRWLEFAARAGEEMVNPLTPAGWRRIRERGLAALAKEAAAAAKAEADRKAMAAGRRP